MEMHCPPLRSCCPLLYELTEISELSLKRVAEPRRPWRSLCIPDISGAGGGGCGVARPGRSPAPGSFPCRSPAGLCSPPVRSAFPFYPLQTVFVF